VRSSPRQQHLSVVPDGLAARRPWQQCTVTQPHFMSVRSSSSWVLCSAFCCSDHTASSSLGSLGAAPISFPRSEAFSASAAIRMFDDPRGRPSSSVCWVAGSKGRARERHLVEVCAERGCLRRSGTKTVGGSRHSNHSWPMCWRLTVTGVDAERPATVANGCLSVASTAEVARDLGGV
jgi:hypothetical protein